MTELVGLAGFQPGSEHLCGGGEGDNARLLCAPSALGGSAVPVSFGLSAGRRGKGRPSAERGITRSPAAGCLLWPSPVIFMAHARDKLALRILLGLGYSSQLVFLKHGACEMPESCVAGPSRSALEAALAAAGAGGHVY